MKQVAVIGLDEFNRKKLESTTYADTCEFITLMEHDEVRGLDEFDFEGLLDTCVKQLDALASPPDAICTFWDFPVAELAVLLADRYGCATTGLTSLTKAHHKYWSRLIQREAVPEAVPEFRAVDPFDPDAVDKLDLPYPYWLKPIRSFRSYLAFEIHNKTELTEALEQIRESIPRLGKPYDDVLGRLDLPPEVAGITGSWCIAEAPIGGRQCTVEGFSSGGDVEVYGIVDSVRAKNRISFRRYEYPSRLPDRIQERMIDLTKRAISAMGYDNAPFNVEFFWDRSADDIWLLEVNARQSQSHAHLFEVVDGVSNHEVMVALALGERPHMPTGEGEFGVGAKWFLRAWHDGEVSRVPTDVELAELRTEFPNLTVDIEVAKGDLLADMHDQGSYSYEIGVVYAAAESNTQLLDDYKRFRAELPLKTKRYK